eukprot:Platyproteum_vivax@DN7253_c0_g1_i1.p2
MNFAPVYFRTQDLKMAKRMIGEVIVEARVLSVDGQNEMYCGVHSMPCIKSVSGRDICKECDTKNVMQFFSKRRFVMTIQQFDDVNSEPYILKEGEQYVLNEGKRYLIPSQY